MKRTMMILVVVAAALAGLVAVGYAYGPGRWGRGYGSGAAAPAYGPGYGRGMMGGYGYGPDMMGGAPGDGFAGPGGYCAGGQQFDSDRMAEMNSYMVTQQKAALQSLQSQLAATTDENAKKLLTARIERVQLQINWSEGRTDVIKALPDDWVKAEIALAQYDVDFYTKATATDTANQAWIAARLQAAKDRLAYFQDQANKPQQ